MWIFYCLCLSSCLNIPHHINWCGALQSSGLCPSVLGNICVSFFVCCSSFSFPLQILYLCFHVGLFLSGCRTSSFSPLILCRFLLFSILLFFVCTLAVPSSLSSSIFWISNVRILFSRALSCFLSVLSITSSHSFMDAVNMSSLTPLRTLKRFLLWCFLLLLTVSSKFHCLLASIMASHVCWSLYVHSHLRMRYWKLVSKFYWASLKSYSNVSVLGHSIFPKMTSPVSWLGY